MKTFAERIIEDGITMTSTAAHGTFLLAGWPEGTRSWRCTLRRGGRRMTVPFHTGPAVADFAAEDVLSCLVSDATSYDDATTLEEWHNTWGTDMEDPAAVRAARRTHTGCAKISAQLHAFLGEKFDAYAYETEGL